MQRREKVEGEGGGQHGQGVLCKRAKKCGEATRERANKGSVHAHMPGVVVQPLQQIRHGRREVVDTQRPVVAPAHHGDRGEARDDAAAAGAGFLAEQVAAAAGGAPPGGWTGGVGGTGGARAAAATQAGGGRRRGSSSRGGGGFVSLLAVVRQRG